MTIETAGTGVPTKRRVIEARETREVEGSDIVKLIINCWFTAERGTGGMLTNVV